MSDKNLAGQNAISVRLKTIKSEINIGLDYIFELYFIEDITKAFHSGKLVFQDKYGILESDSITGQELVYVLLGVEKQVQYVFQIYSIDEVSPMSQSEEGTTFAVYELHLVSLEYTKLYQNKYSRSWQQEKISTIIKDIYTKMIDSEVKWKHFEETKEKIDFCMPYWTPMESINWLMRRASGSESGTAGYLLYQNNEGMNFATIEKLLRNSGDIEKDANGTAKYMFEVKNSLYENKILEWKLTGVDRQSEYMLQGGTNYGFDPITKQLIEVKYTYKDVMKKYTMQGKKTLFPDISSSTVRGQNFGDSDFELLKNIGYSDMIKRYITQFQVKLIVRGHERRHAGMLAEIDWPSTKRQNKKHKQYNGKYLITTIVHQYQKGITPEWRQNVTLVKTAYDDSDFTQLLNA